MNPRTDVIGNVHLIFKTHLDVGFTNLAGNVVNRYFTEFIPAALATAATSRDTSPTDRFIWTTGSWLIYEYFERAGEQDRKRLEHAIEAGDIVWHAMPFTVHSEYVDPSLFSFGLRLSQTLDRRFGRRTIAAKMTDVPGHTRAIVPLLAHAGVEFLHIGVNEASTVPDVPPVFVWRDPSGAEITVMYHHTYGATMTVPGLADCISFAHTMDNSGPQSAGEVREIYARLKDEFPRATVRASTLNEFALALRDIRTSLPVVTEEIGDTWIHGVASDPTKSARYRELCRLRSEWKESDPQIEDNPSVARFSRSLLMVGEHTWGLDDKTHLGDYEHYRQHDFASVMDAPNFLKMEESWEEQRRYVSDSVEALGETDRGREAQARLASIAPRRPSPADKDRVDLDSLEIATDNLCLSFDPTSGAICRLLHRGSGRELADRDHPLGTFSYHGFSHEDYARFLRQYITSGEDWALWDFGKPQLEQARVESGNVPVRVSDAWLVPGQTQTVVMRLAPDVSDHDTYGGPREIFISAEIPADRCEIALDLQWFGKPASRLPQSCSYSFVPIQGPNATWRLRKLGAEISPTEVVSNGARRFHAVHDYVECRDDVVLRLTTLDAPLVGAGSPGLLDFTDERPLMQDGVHFILYNNVWGTNFPSWFGGDARFRFVLRLRDQI